MNTNGANNRRGRTPRPRQSTRQTQSLKVNKSITHRRKERTMARKSAKAEYLASLPKEPLKRFLARLRPRHLMEYWFSREGAIMALKVIGLSIVACFFLLIAIFAYFKKDILAISSISGNNVGGSISFYDRTGKVLLFQDYGTTKRIPVKSTAISNYMKQATVAIEDKKFYTEGGFDIGSIFRSGYHDIVNHGRGLEGASTITEQVVKLNKGWPDPLSIPEKLEEIILAAELSRDYTKDQILTAYLNVAPYGNIDYGVQAAAEDYFHEPASQLSLAQAAFLASIPQAPTAYSPYSSPTYNPAATVNYFDSTDLIARQHYVLSQMAQQHMITQAQADQAKTVNVLAQIQPLQSKYQNIKAPYFVMAAKQQLQKMYGSRLVSHGALNVTTTLNLPLQQLADQTVQSNIPNVVRYGADEEALVAESVKTGQVVALVGGTNFNNPDHGQINYAMTNVSPGSSIKPFVYSTFINNSPNVGAGSVLYDVEQPLPGYPCTNKNRPDQGGNCLMDYDFRFPGATTIRYALAGSRNVPAVKAGLMAGIPKVQQTASAMMGYPNAYRCYPAGTNVMTATAKDQSPCYGDAAIGGGYLDISQEVNGDATLARLGQEIPQTYILSITDSNGNNLYQWKQPKPVQAIKTDTAYIIDNILSDPRASYLPGSCSATTCTPLYRGGYKWQRYNGWDIAVKTGTENNNYDGLMTAWDTQYAVVTWTAYHTYNRQLKAGGMEVMTEPLARGWMQGALDQLNTKPQNWTQPSDIKTIPAFVQRAHVGLGSEEPGPIKEIFPSWYSGKGSNNVTQVIDKVSGGIATSCTPADAKETISGISSNSFSVDKFWPLNQSQTQNTSKAVTTYDDVHQCSDQPPQVTLTAPQQCSNTDNGGQGCAITITATQGTHPLSGGNFGGTITLAINGTTVKTFDITGSPATATYYYQPTSSGTVSVTATVTDSVLYQASQTAQMSTTFNQPATAPTPSTNGNTNPPVKKSGGSGNGNG